MVAAITYQERKDLAADTGVCIRWGCLDRAQDDAACCAKHLAEDREAKKLYRRRQRKARKKANECRDCGTPLRPSETVWCKAHRIRRNRLNALRQGGVPAVVEKPVERVRSELKSEEGRMRYHGHGKRGEPTHAEKNKIDLKHAEQTYAGFKEGVTLLGTDDAKTWPRGEKQRVIDATINQAEQHIRRLEDVLERFGYFKVRKESK